IRLLCGSDHSNERCKFKVIESGYGLSQGGGGTRRKQAVNVALLRDFNHRMDCIRQQLRVLVHVGTVSCRLIKYANCTGHWLVVGTASSSQEVKQVLGFCMVGDHVAFLVQVDKVVRVETVTTVPVLCSQLRIVGVNISQCKDHAGH